MIVGVIGQKAFDSTSRDYDDFQHVASVLDTYCGTCSELISGGAKGPETLAIQWAKSKNFSYRKVSPNISLEMDGLTDDQRANPLSKKAAVGRAFRHRDEEILVRSDILVLFWNGIVPTALSLISMAARLRRRIIIEPLHPDTNPDNLPKLPSL